MENHKIHTVTAEALMSAIANENGQRLHEAGKVYTYKDGTKAVFIKKEKYILTDQDKADYIQNEIWRLRQEVEYQIKRSQVVLVMHFQQYDAYHIEGSFHSFGLDSPIYVKDFDLMFDIIPDEDEEFTVLAKLKPGYSIRES